MKNPREFLENWIFGLFGFEERTFITVRRLIKTLTDDGVARIQSTLVDYENLDFYEFELKITRTQISNRKKSQSEKDSTIIGKLISDYNTIEAYEKYWKSKQEALKRNED